MKTLSNLMNLEQRVAVVTGGTGYLGGAIAETLAELGCTICLIDRPGSPLSDRCDAIANTWEVKTFPLEVNLEDEQERNQVLGFIQSNLGGLDILVNNAAFVGDSHLQGWSVPFEEQRLDTWRRAFEVNLTAAFHLSQSLAPLLKIGGKGSIINIGSIYGVLGPDMRLYKDLPMGNPAAYAASKGGLIQLTRWLSAVLSPEIRVNCISPGGIARGQPDLFVERYVARTPLQRMGTEEDIKGAIAYFASDLSQWVTGENLMVDGGWSVW